MNMNMCNSIFNRCLTSDTKYDLHTKVNVSVMTKTKPNPFLRKVAYSIRLFFFNIICPVKVMIFTLIGISFQ